MDIFKNGLSLLILGMGTVFCFLTLMVICIQASSNVAAKFAHLLPDEKKTKPKKRKKAPAQTPVATNNNVLVAVISAAVQQYRNEH